MNFNEYQDTAWELAQYPQTGCNVVYPALGLSGEAGEAADKVKKIWRNQGLMSGLNYNEQQRLELAKEIGDVLWYIGAIGKEIGWSLEDIAALNIEKLVSRRERGVIKGEGDNR